MSRIFAILLLALAAPLSAGERLSSRTRVLDGDTVAVGGVTIRLKGIATPEIAHPTRVEPVGDIPSGLGAGEVYSTDADATSAGAAPKLIRRVNRAVRLGAVAMPNTGMTALPARVRPI